MGAGDCSDGGCEGGDCKNCGCRIGDGDAAVVAGRGTPGVGVPAAIAAASALESTARLLSLAGAKWASLDAMRDPGMPELGDVSRRGRAFMADGYCVLATEDAASSACCEGGIVGAGRALLTVSVPPSSSLGLGRAFGTAKSPTVVGSAEIRARSGCVVCRCSATTASTTFHCARTCR